MRSVRQSGLTRRELLSAGAGGILGASALMGSRSEAATVRPTRAKSVILLWMDGGPSQFETFDPKPEAPVSIRGEFGSIKTSVAGIHVSELLPRMSRLLHHCAVVRGVSHDEWVHERACHALMTGAPAEGEGIAPSLGSLAASLSPKSGAWLYAALPCTSFAFGYARAGELGAQYDPVCPAKSSPELLSAMSIAAESERVRGLYGDHEFGRNCLRARRLVESGVQFVAVSLGGWDAHSDISMTSKHLVPHLDRGMAALLLDLERRGMLAETLVVWMGEFGRSPEINALGGRDHWPKSCCAVFGGAGIPGGQLIGSTDRRGWEPEERQISPSMIAATILLKLRLAPERIASAGAIPEFS